jgi:hypothetical protein
MITLSSLGSGYLQIHNHDGSTQDLDFDQAVTMRNRLSNAQFEKLQRTGTVRIKIIKDAP